MKTVQELREKTLTPAEKKKREEIAKAIEKDNPDMPMDKKMAIATAQAKKVAESVDFFAFRKSLAEKKESVELDEASKEGTIRIIDLGNRKQDSIRKELGVDGLPNKGFQVQSMTKGKFVNLGKPYKDLKSAEEFRRTRQHSMQFEHGVNLKATDFMESVELDEEIDFRKAHQEIMAYAKKSGGIDKTDFEKVAYYVKAIGDNQNSPNVANKAFMAMKKFVGDMDTDPRDGVMLMLKKHGMMKNGRLVQESITEARRQDAAKDLYFDTYTAAVQHAKAQAEKKGFEVVEDDWFNQVTTGKGKPGRGKTTRHTLKLTKNDKPVRQSLSIQVYNRDTDKKPYELNFYVS